MSSSRRFVAIMSAILMLVGLAGGTVAAEPVTTGTGTALAGTAVAPATAAAAGVVASILPFTSLAAALAAQPAAALAEADEALRCMATTIYYEAKGEPLDGQLAVAEVILNRTRSGRYPPQVCGVVTQAGQFSFVRGGVLPTIDPTRPSFVTALAVARVAMAKAWESSAPRALFFHARRVAAGARMVRVAAIGNHIFYR